MKTNSRKPATHTATTKTKSATNSVEEFNPKEWDEEVSELLSKKTAERTPEDQQRIKELENKLWEQIRKRRAEKTPEELQNSKEFIENYWEQIRNRRAARTPEEQQQVEIAMLSELSEHSLKSRIGVDKQDGYYLGRQKQLASQVEELRVRFLFLVNSVAAVKYRYEWLEKHTSIPAMRWKNVLLEKQLPTIEMLLAINNLHGRSAEWLICGSIPDTNDPFNSPYAPSEAGFNEFKAQRDWINEKRQAKSTARKTKQD